MTKKATNDVKDRALARINAIRKAFGKRRLARIPKGKLLNHRDCPMARVLIGLAPPELRPLIGVNRHSITIDVPPEYQHEATEFANQLATAMETRANLRPRTYLGTPRRYEIRACSAVRAFVHAFDARTYPELIAKS